tara:strand:+ start:1313 stop:1909 length:597 start_codon:yes stop_codon:yes gene_type:complete
MDFILETYIKDISICDRLVDFFNNSEYSRLRKRPGTTSGGITPTQKESTDLSIFPQEFSEPELSPIGDYIPQLFGCVDEYVAKYAWCNASTAQFGILERINIQFYKPGEAFHGWHFERGSSDFPACGRHLVWMTYLNDVDDGGGTEFFYQEKVTTARKGKTVIWPADWTHTHKGEVSNTEHKYIITGWLNYDLTSIKM